MLANHERSNLLRVRVGCDVLYDMDNPTPMQFVVQALDAAEQQVVQEIQVIEPELPIDRVRDSYGNAIWRVVAPAGRVHLRYDALVAVSALPDQLLVGLQKTPVYALPGAVISYLWPSRYCPSDLMLGDAWRLFGHIEGGWAQVQAVCDWIQANIEYGAGSTSTTDSLDVYRARRGVCRDFAHLAISFCRALNIPARYVCGYLPDIGVEPPPTPMDFHAWFQVWLDGAWRTFDARHNRPRTGRTLVATGRDAVDGAWATVFGSGQLVQLEVWAEEVDVQFRLADTGVNHQAKV